MLRNHTNLYNKAWRPQLCAYVSSTGFFPVDTARGSAEDVSPSNLLSRRRRNYCARLVQEPVLFYKVVALVI